MQHFSEKQSAAALTFEDIYQLLPKIGEFLPPGDLTLLEINKDARKHAVHLPLRFFDHDQIKFPEEMSENDHNNVFAVLKKIQRTSANNLTLQELFEIFNDKRHDAHEEVMRILVSVCQTDGALSARVVQTDFLRDKLSDEEKIADPKSLVGYILSKLLGAMLGMTGAVVRVIRYSACPILIGIILVFSPLYVIVALIAYVVDREMTLEGFKSEIYGALLFFGGFLKSLFFLIPCMLDAIYRGYDLGAERSWESYFYLCSYDDSKEQLPCYGLVCPHDGKYFNRARKTIAQLAQRYTKKYSKILNRLNDNPLDAHEKRSAASLFSKIHEITFPEEMSVDEKHNIVIALDMIQRTSTFKSQTLQKLFEILCDTEHAKHLGLMQTLIDACRIDGALAVRVIQANFLRNLLIDEEKIAYPKGLAKRILSKLLGIILGIVGAIIRVILYVCHIVPTIFQAAAYILDGHEAMLTCFMDMLLSPIFLIISMLDSIYMGYALGVERAWKKYSSLCMYASWFSTDNITDAFCQVVVDPKSSGNKNATYFEHIHETVAQLAQKHSEKHSEIVDRLNEKCKHTYAREQLSATFLPSKEEEKVASNCNENFARVDDDFSAITHQHARVTPVI